MGNDVVDLKDPGNRGKSDDGRFLDRVCTPAERRLIAAASAPDELLWALWAAKEAAYKAVSRSEPAVPSVPRRYEVSLDPEGPRRRRGALCGRVATPRGELALAVALSADTVHAVAAGNRAIVARLCRRVERIDTADGAADPSAFVRRMLLQEIASRLDCPAGDLAVVTPPGFAAPLVFRRGAPLTGAVSLSHDGRFAAFALDPDALAGRA